MIDPDTLLQYEYADEDMPDFGSPSSANINPVTPPGEEQYATPESLGAGSDFSGEVDEGYTNELLCSGYGIEEQFEIALQTVWEGDSDGVTGCVEEGTGLR
jgi:hypothetical protein